MKEPGQAPSVSGALSRIVRDNRHVLGDRLREVLLASIYDNRYTLHPRQIAAYADGQVDGFLAFLDADASQPAEELGRKGAAEGLGEVSVLALLSTIQGFLVERAIEGQELEIQSVLRIAEKFRQACLTGYLFERKEQTLKDQEQLRRALSSVLERQSRELRVRNYAINTAINGVMISDLDGAITYVNAAFLKMWKFQDASEVLGVSAGEFWAGDQAREIFQDLPRTGGWHGELTAIRDDRSTFEVEMSASIIRDETGIAVGIMSSFIDITEAKRLRSHVFHRQKMEALGELAGRIAHDFNNLLTAISGYVQLLLADVEPEGQFHSDLSQIKTAVDRGADLTKQLRYFTRQASGVRQVVDVNELIKETYDLVKRTFPLDIDVKSSLAADVWTVEADPSQVSQVLMNLCVNARDAILNAESAPPGEARPRRSRGGMLEIVSENVSLSEAEASVIYEGRSGKFVRIRVRDNGVGMSPSVSEKLFEPFFTTKELRSGSGLGLAVVYGIVHNHNGFIGVQSELGHGSTFDIYLPPVDKQVLGRPSTVAPLALKRAQGDILVVDDEKQVGAILERALKRWGYSAAVFSDAREAVKYFNTRHDDIDLVILDMLMPKMDGRECFARLREIDPQVKVVVITGYTSEISSSGEILEGAAATVEKPLDLARFAGVLEDVLRRPA